MYAILRPVDDVLDAKWEVRDGVPTLEEMQKAVGGLVQVIGLRSGVDLWVNEEGLIRKLPPTVVVEDERRRIHHILVGPVVATRSDREGETTSLRAGDITGPLALEAERHRMNLAPGDLRLLPIMRLDR